MQVLARKVVGEHGSAALSDAATVIGGTLAQQRKQYGSSSYNSFAAL
jgi:hypothetical protein